MCVSRVRQSHASIRAMVRPKDMISNADVHEKLRSLTATEPEVADNKESVSKLPLGGFVATESDLDRILAHYLSSEHVMNKVSRGKLQPKDLEEDVRRVARSLMYHHGIKAGKPRRADRVGHSNPQTEGSTNTVSDPLDTAKVHPRGDFGFDSPRKHEIEMQAFSSRATSRVAQLVRKHVHVMSATGHMQNTSNKFADTQQQTVTAVAEQVTSSESEPDKERPKKSKKKKRRGHRRTSSSRCSPDGTVEAL